MTAKNRLISRLATLAWLTAIQRLTRSPRRPGGRALVGIYDALQRVMTDASLPRATQAFWAQRSPPADSTAVAWSGGISDPSMSYVSQLDQLLRAASDPARASARKRVAGDSRTRPAGRRVLATLDAMGAQIGAADLPGTAYRSTVPRRLRDLLRTGHLPPRLEAPGRVRRERGRITFNALRDAVYGQQRKAADTSLPVIDRVIASAAASRQGATDDVLDALVLTPDERERGRIDLSGLADQAADLLRPRIAEAEQFYAREDWYAEFVGPTRPYVGPPPIQPILWGDAA